jgi:hypothetical protein
MKSKHIYKKGDQVIINGFTPTHLYFPLNRTVATVIKENGDNGWTYTIRYKSPANELIDMVMPNFYLRLHKTLAQVRKEKIESI